MCYADKVVLCDSLEVCVSFMCKSTLGRAGGCLQS